MYCWGGGKVGRVWARTWNTDTVISCKLNTLLPSCLSFILFLLNKADYVPRLVIMR